MPRLSAPLAPACLTLLALAALLGGCGEDASGDRGDDRSAPSPPATSGPPEPATDDAGGAAVEPDAAEPGPVADDGDDTDNGPDTEAALAAVMADARRLRDAGEFRSARSQVGVALRNLGLTPEQAGPLKALRQELMQLERDAVQLGKAIDLLGSKSAAEVGYASNLLKQGGEAARVLLRRTVREGEPAAVANAADLLAQLSDPLAAGDLLDRLASEPPLPPATVASVYDALGTLAAVAQASFYPRLYGRFVDAGPDERRLAAEALIDAYTFRADGDPEAFGELVGVEDARDRLTSYVSEMLTGQDADTVAWARASAAALGVSEPGVRAAYYGGTEFGELLLERLEPAPGVTEESLPIERKENISARWTGELVIETAGEYSFWSTADDGQRVYLDGDVVIDNWAMQSPTTQTAKSTLSPGLHPFKVEWMQGGSGFVYKLEWAGPGFERRAATVDDFRVSPWPGMKRADGAD